MAYKLSGRQSRGILLTLSLLSGAFAQSTNYTISTVAGTGNGDGGPAVASGLAAPQGLAVDAAGNLYIADPKANCVRKVGADGTIITFAGTGRSAFSGDGGPATSAALNNPAAVAVDRSGAVYI